MSCMFYFNWWAYYWESKFFSDPLFSAAWYSPGLSLLVMSLSWTKWGKAGKWTAAARAFLEHYFWHTGLYFATSLKSQKTSNEGLQLLLSRPQEEELRAEMPSPGPHYRPRVQSGAGFRFTSLSPVLTSTICCHLPPDEKGEEWEDWIWQLLPSSYPFS